MTEPFSKRLQQRLDDALDLEQVLPLDGDLPEQAEPLAEADVDRWVQGAVRGPAAVDDAPAGLVRSFRRRRVGKRAGVVGVLAVLAALGTRSQWSGRDGGDLPYREALDVVLDAGAYTEENRNLALGMIARWCRYGCEALGERMRSAPSSGARSTLLSIQSQLRDPRPGAEIGWWDPPIEEIVKKARERPLSDEDTERLDRMIRAGIYQLHRAKGQNPLMDSTSEVLSGRLGVQVDELLQR